MHEKEERMKLTRPVLAAGVISGCIGLGVGFGAIAGAATTTTTPSQPSTSQPATNAPAQPHYGNGNCPNMGGNSTQSTNPSNV
jgi:hypothetical protein